MILHIIHTPLHRSSRNRNRNRRFIVLLVIVMVYIMVYIMVMSNILDYGVEKCFRLWYRKMFQIIWFRKIFCICGNNILDYGVEKCFRYMLIESCFRFYGLEKYFAFMATIFQIMVQKNFLGFMVQKNVYRFYGLEQYFAFMVQLYIQFRIWFFDTVSLFFIFYPAARGRGAPKDHHSKIFKIHISQKFPWVVFLNRHRSLGFILNLTTSGPFHGPLDNKRASIQFSFHLSMQYNHSHFSPQHDWICRPGLFFWNRNALG